MELDRQEFEELLKDLRKWFPPEDHVERKLKGGSKWWYVKWQKIRERFDDVFGSLWSEEYSDPYYVLDPTGNHEKSLCVVKCVIEIDGRKRQGVGQAPLQIISGTGNDASRGTPIERAVAEAFKNAAESWGVARYLDDQTDEKSKAAFFKYLAQRGNSKPLNGMLKEKGVIPTRTRSADKDAPSIIQSASEVLEPLKAAIATEMERVGWTPAQAKEHIKTVYGKTSRNQMTEAELKETLEYLKSLEGAIAL